MSPIEAMAKAAYEDWSRWGAPVSPVPAWEMLSNEERESWLKPQRIAVQALICYEPTEKMLEAMRILDARTRSDYRHIVTAYLNAVLNETDKLDRMS
jgi:hypothetical protein